MGLRKTQWTEIVVCKQLERLREPNFFGFYTESSDENNVSNHISLVRLWIHSSLVSFIVQRTRTENTCVIDKTESTLKVGEEFDD